LTNINSSQVIDAYESSVQDLATELELRTNLTCVAPDASGDPGARLDAGSVPIIFDAIYQAFACDLASAVTYSIGGETINQQRHTFLYDDSENDAGLLADLRANLHAASHKETDQAYRAQELVRTWHMSQVADLVDRLATTPDVDGSMLLDNTVIYLASAMSQNTHRKDDFCLAAIAGANTNLKGGMHYDCSGSTNNDLLTTLAQSVNVPVTDHGGYDQGGTRIAGLNNGPIGKMLKEVVS